MDPLNIAIYGGSFDPPTLGHLMVVTHLLLNDPSVDRISIPPCFQQQGKTLTDFHHRKTMCELQFGFLPRIEVSTLERDLGGESLTYRLIQEMVRQQPKARFRFVMGADLLDTAPHWEGWEEIRRLAPPLIIGRAGIKPEGPGDPSPISPAVSSTIVRDALGKGDYHTAERYISAPVCQYIRQEKLYRI